MEATLVNILVRIVSIVLAVSCALPAFAGESIKLGAILAETGPASFSARARMMKAS